MKRKIIIFLSILILWIQQFPLAAAETNSVLKAAFIKNDDLWIKIKESEVRITNGKYVRFPKWSYDGNWIAYISGVKEEYSPLFKGDLWIYNIKRKQHFKISSNVNNNFQWAPNQNSFGFQSNNELKMIDVKFMKEQHKISSGVIEFSWLPDGRGFLTSNKAGESVYSDIVLSKFILKHNNQYERQHFYTIRVAENEHYYGTSQFKWSYDRSWIAFQLVPTASLSADSNTICVLSNDGAIFHKINEMLHYEEWFAWAKSVNYLAYIKGSNRVSTLNKKLEIIKMSNDTKFGFTPKGYVDRDLTWKTNNQIYVSRSVENDLIEVGQRPLPSIYHINLQTKKQKKSTFPLANEGDFYPLSINDGEKLVWIRTNRKQASVLIAGKNGKNQRIWIKNINLGTWYYEHWNWNEVFNLYQS
ncbi:translocation protein TolB [Gottfriedia sp. S16(2024)]|uniref:TolB family protein n=1 Tax=Gottfriedia sp. S16(2024) TaxID=3162883 RepID=UPI003D2294D4